jgi:hypothetical protein
MKGARQSAFATEFTTFQWSKKAQRYGPRQMFYMRQKYYHADNGYFKLPA